MTVLPTLKGRLEAPITATEAGSKSLSRLRTDMGAARDPPFGGTLAFKVRAICCGARSFAAPQQNRHGRGVGGTLQRWNNRHFSDGHFSVRCCLSALGECPIIRLRSNQSLLRDPSGKP